jgi:hypothetical protein
MQTWPPKSQRGLAKAERDANIEAAELARANFFSAQAPKASERKEAEMQANLAQAAALKAEFKQRNPDNKDLPPWLPFGEKMEGGRPREDANYGDNRKGGGPWGRNYMRFWTF